MRFKQNHILVVIPFTCSFIYEADRENLQDTVSAVRQSYKDVTVGKDKQKREMEKKERLHFQPAIAGRM